jgi:hypothetical protein
MTTFHLDAGSKRPSAVDGRGRDKKTGRCGLDYLPRVTDDEATELMVHHLEIAAIYYKNTPDDHAAILVEVTRLMTRELPGFHTDALAGALGFLTAISDYHERLKKQQNEEEKAEGLPLAGSANADEVTG